MHKISRRALAKYCADELVSGISSHQIAPMLASVLVENNMTDHADFLVQDVAWELEKSGHLAMAKVISAAKLSIALNHQLEKSIKLLTRTKTVIIDKQIDSSLIGGVRIETSNRVWDHTITGKLNYLREET